MDALDRPSQQNAERVLLLAVQDLHVADAALLPLFRRRLEAVQFGTVAEDDPFAFLARLHFDQIRQRDDRFEMRVVALGSLIAVPFVVIFGGGDGGAAVGIRS